MHSLHKKWKFSIQDFFNKCDRIRSFLVRFTEEIPNKKPESFSNRFLEQLFCRAESMFAPASIKKNSTTEFLQNFINGFSWKLFQIFKSPLRNLARNLFLVALQTAGLRLPIWFKAKFSKRLEELIFGTRNP